MKAKGIANPQPTPGAMLSAEIIVPKGTGPFPAVVLNHDCRGIQAYQRAFAQKLATWGYLILVLDSYGPRNVVRGSVCANLSNWDTKDFIGGRTLDVYGALGFLAVHKQVDPARLMVIGWDRDTTMSTVAKSGLSATFPKLKPRAAVAIAPDCRRMSSGEFVTSILILAAGKDDWWPAANCQKLLAASKAGNGIAVALETYQDAQHGFDDPAVGARTTIVDAYNPNKSPARGATLAFNATATADAHRRIKLFLAEHTK